MIGINGCQAEMVATVTVSVWHPFLITCFADPMVA